MASSLGAVTLAPDSQASSFPGDDIHDPGAGSVSASRLRAEDLSFGSAVAVLAATPISAELSQLSLRLDLCSSQSQSQLGKDGSEVDLVSDAGNEDACLPAPRRSASTPKMVPSPSLEQLSKPRRDQCSDISLVGAGVDHDVSSPSTPSATAIIIDDQGKEIACSPQRIRFESTPRRQIVPYSTSLVSPPPQSVPDSSTRPPRSARAAQQQQQAASPLLFGDTTTASATSPVASPRPLPALGDVLSGQRKRGRSLSEQSVRVDLDGRCIRDDLDGGSDDDEDHDDDGYDDATGRVLDQRPGSDDNDNDDDGFNDDECALDPHPPPQRKRRRRAAAVAAERRTMQLTTRGRARAPVGLAGRRIMLTGMDRATRRALSDMVHAAGGVVVTGFPSCSDKGPVPILVSDRPRRTRKYLVASARGWPVFPSSWVRDGCDAALLVRSSQGYAPLSTPPLHQDMVCLLGFSAAERLHWAAVATAAGARVSAAAPSAECTVVVAAVAAATTLCTELRCARLLSLPVVSCTWLVVCAAARARARLEGFLLDQHLGNAADSRADQDTMEIMHNHHKH